MNRYYGQNHGQCPYGKVPNNLDNDEDFDCRLPSKADKIQLVEYSTVLGICILLYFAVSRSIPKLLFKFNLVEAYLNNEYISVAIDSLVSIASILLPFAIGLLLIKILCKDKRVLQFNKPNSKKLFGASLLVGLGALMVSNWLTSMFVYFMGGMGVELTSPENFTFSGGFGLYLLYIVRGAVCPALIEEFAFRGVVMQPLRKYGDGFAIVISSLMFALLHGNLVQAPFAFMIGAVIGYLVIITNTMWTGVLIHFINNAFSITMSMLADKVNNEIYYMVFGVISLIFVVVGVFGTIIVWKEKNNFYIYKHKAGNFKPNRRKYNKSVYLTYLINPVLIIAIILIGKVMADYISLG